jgi:hypothetical protein
LNVDKRLYCGPETIERERSSLSGFEGEIWSMMFLAVKIWSREKKRKREEEAEAETLPLILLTSYLRM